MMAAWMLYSLAVGGLIAAAALAGDFVCRMLRIPVRVVWAGGMLMTLALSSAALFDLKLSRTEASPVRVEAGSLMEHTPVAEMTPVSALADFLGRVGGVVGGGADRRYAAAVGALPDGRGLSAAWLLASTLLFVLLCGTLLRLGRARRTWSAHRIHDVQVLVSRDAGPALIGLLRPSIVVPAWLLEEPEERQRLVVQHELEHRRAGDHMLLAAASMAVCLLPWNVALWWMFLRIRLAVELDCDARVLRRGVKPRPYGSLLLEIAGRTRTRPFGAPALADSGTHLERRLIAMTDSNHTPRRMRVAGAGLSGLLLAAAACTADLPTAAALDEMDVEQARARAEYSGLLLPTPEKTPVFIVDGVLVEEEVAKEIAPDEISSIEVMKGPAALQAYGERAEHGAVLIRTRSAEPADGAVIEGVKVPLGEPLERAAINRPGTELTITELHRKVEEFEGRAVEFEATAVELEALVDQAGTAVDSLNRGQELRLRGLQEASPLIILDGVIMSDSFWLSSLAPDSIESVEIVKGAAARRLYSDGRAVNGVIRITTKAGGK